ncbi:ankyrin repeat domain-containing protein [Vibrio crassostreae]|uniref:ankyrin repeat domain-containing protein n=1 Tax=Vibrio crassostreae TaxID=246167 RepID=UPI0002E672BA|nr:ankyrin repeat domain-containing protein [Vibrio crassostreae]OEE86236.1 ankryin [Vibrio crassostreae 9ZC88]
MTMLALHQLIINGQFEQFTQAIEQGADVNQLEPLMGNSPLHVAAQQSSQKWVEALIEAGAFINLQTPKHGVTPLMVAVWHRKPQVVAKLLTYADINIEIISTFGLRAEQLTMFGASNDDQFGLAQSRELKQLFSEYTSRRDSQINAMSAYQVVTNSNLTDEQAFAALDEIEGVLATLNQTSPITCSGNDEHTAVMVAARDGKVKVLEKLMALGGDQTIVDHYMKAVPLHKAAYNGRVNVIECLKGFAGFQETLNAQGPNNGYTPLHDAIWHGHLDAAKALVDAGALQTLKGFDGKTPLELAKEYHYQEIVDLLEKKL